MKKALIYASVASMIEQFNMDNISILQSLGYEVDVACNFEHGSSISSDKIKDLKLNLTSKNIKFYNVPIARKISNVKDNFKAYNDSKKILDLNNYDLIHCHSPVGALICRLANKNSKNYATSKMIYTAHGFHFFKGNKWYKNLLFYTIEKQLAKITDVIITINSDDYNAANKFKLKSGGKVKYVPGVGIDISKIRNQKVDRNIIRKSLGITENDILLLSVGELNENKNHELVIKELSKVPQNIHYAICGQGHLKDKFENMARKDHVESRLHLLGYCTNVVDYMKSADIFVFPSFREGLGLSALEAMACSLPLITSNRGGIKDYTKNDVNSIVIDPTSSKEMLQAILELSSDEIKRNKFSLHNYEVACNYDIEIIRQLMNDIYLEQSK